MADTASAPDIQLEAGTYEIIRNRLTSYGKDLRARLVQLNDARKEVFGSIDTALIATDRITTAHNCVPHDIAAIGGRLLFGYNVHFGLKAETALSDVFAVYEFRDNSFHELSLDLIADSRFEKDFHDVYRYYKHATFSKFMVRGPYLYMVFQVGTSADDMKTFKWAIQSDTLVYVDNRSDHEVHYPPQHDFQWTRTRRDQHQSGEHPHISIEDRVFVETVGGDLTIKVEDNTDSGEGIYSEPVDDPDQRLDDADVSYAIVGNIILLKIRPYQEKAFRHFVFNEKTGRAMRLDAIEHACVLLPDDHGLIFPNGYYLQTGEHKTFDHSLTDMMFERRLPAANGEDYLYVFYSRVHGTYILLEYNVIEQSVGTPIICSGLTFFRDGRMLCFKRHEQPQKHHAVQVWQTPYVGEDFVPHANTDSMLYKIGNRDIVRGMAECHEVLALIDKEDTYAGLYVDIAKETRDILDSYFWIDKPETFNLAESVKKIHEAASAAVDEYEKVVRVKENTARETQRVDAQTQEIFREVKHRRFEKIGDFVASLSDLRKVRGEIIALRDLRYVDTPLIDALEKQVGEESDRLARRCVEFLLRRDALDPYIQRVEAEQAGIDDLEKVADAKKVEEQITASAAELEMLIEIVSNLKIDDATHRTTIIDNISAIFSKVNQARAALKKKTQELLSVEGIAEFNSQMKLLNQAVVNYLDVCDSPEKCEDYLTKVMIQIEELEGRFAEFDEFVLQLTDKREEVYNAFETRKLQLVDARNKRANAIMSAAERILKGIKTRVESFDSVEDIHGYFAADLMIEKVRKLIAELDELGDSVKVDDIQSRLKTIREDAVRQLKDRKELFVEGENVIRFGRHLFNVNVQTLDLTTVLRDDQMQFHLTGTNFFEPVAHADLLATRDVWDQEIVSENREVYRGEYLAYQLLQAAQQQHPDRARQADGKKIASALRDPVELLKLSDDELVAAVTQFMGPRYSEAYVKGVHDHDAARMFKGLLEMERSIGLLRYHTRARALATLFWRHFEDAPRKQLISAKLKGYGTVARLFPNLRAQQDYVEELRELIGEFVARTELIAETASAGSTDSSAIAASPWIGDAAEYLFHELITGEESFAVSRTAAQMCEEFRGHLKRSKFADDFAASVEAVRSDSASAFRLCRDWIGAFVANRNGVVRGGHASAGRFVVDETEYVDEAAAVLVGEDVLNGRKIIDADVVRVLDGMVGTHPVIRDGQYRLDYNRFMLKLDRFERETVPRFNRYVQLKKDVVAAARAELRLDEFRPRVLTSFVRNKLIDSVYLPLVGDNLAKQVGTAGENKRTDRMGLLLLVSPPGYGKTTLMEYIANRLGIIFMKINGPALGHQVTSLDPAAAPNAGAREEVEKLNLALEMGDNVMIYLDDIQHCHPEFLQKFISLCDATRKIEGVYKGRTRTYDLRGRKVAVVMAGNPYTESGEKFQIPDMLSNRADIYNLGEIIGENADAFEMSFLENCLTSNPTLAKLASRSQKDVYAVIKMAADGSREGVDLDGNYSVEELNEFVAVMKKLIRVRDVILKVNREYIRSAAMADEYRTEPAFKLQGSYRNMNRIAEKVAPVMNDDELQSLIVSNYENDSQTLTTGAEANLLKFKEIVGILTETEAARWNDIKKTFQRNNRLRGVDEQDKVGQVIVQLSAFGEGLEAIRDCMTAGMKQLAEHNGWEETVERQAAELVGGLHGLREGLQQIQQAMSEGMSRLDHPSSAPAATAPADRASQEITVVNKIPPTLLRVLQHQFKLMQNWMKPILETTQHQTAEIQELRQQLDACLNNYSRLIGAVEESKSSKKPKSKS